jgi:hypothetical protein
MAEIKWKRSTAITWFCVRGKFVLKKKQVAGGYLYQVWKGEVLKYDTFIYIEFMQCLMNLYTEKWGEA